MKFLLNYLFFPFLSILSLTSATKNENAIHKQGECNILALSGGGSFGMVEVGIMTAMYERGQIPEHFDLISGISAGGLNVGFLSYYNNTSNGINDLYGLYANLQNDDVYTLDILKILDNWSIYSTTPLKNTLNNVINNKTPDPSYTPYTIIGTSNVEKEHLDIYHFNSLSNTDKVGLLLSTSAIPIVFPPQHFNGSLYVDGGLISNELIYQSLQFIECDFYNVYFISASEHNEVNVKVDGLFSFLSSVVKMIYHTFNYQLSELSNHNCTQPNGRLNACFPNSTQLNQYSILDFDNGKELFNIAKNNYYCKEYTLC